uniref:Uncharacterized protein n=1 Tax=Arundo donax TaxID=35708 RepID=A0A0A9CUM9_ARUDO
MGGGGCSDLIGGGGRGVNRWLWQGSRSPSSSAPASSTRPRRAPLPPSLRLPSHSSSPPGSPPHREIPWTSGTGGRRRGVAVVGGWWW